MKPVDIVRIASKIDKRSLALDLVRNGDATLLEQILAPLWKNLDTDYVRSFMVDSAMVRFVCYHRLCPVDKSIETAKGATIAEAKEYFSLGFFTAGGTALVPFVNGRQVDDSYRLQGGEVVEFRLPE
jgi:hypothetical protein